MRVVDPGHAYLLDELDPDRDPESNYIVFVKRVGPEYPGNVRAWGGTTTQDVIRVLIDRMKYVNGQKPHETNTDVILNLRRSLYFLEARAAEMRGEELLPWSPLPDRDWLRADIENEPTCPTCGHIRCSRH